MSREYSSYKIKCKCGKGKIRVTIETNDFLGSSRYEELICEECRKFEKEKNDKYNHLTENVLTYFKENHLEKWKLLFVDIKSKKCLGNT